MTDSKAQHPWAKYYSERGLARPAMADLVRNEPVRRPELARSGANSAAPAALSSELAAAVAAVTNDSVAPSTATPFITAMQREAAARQSRRQLRTRLAWRALTAVAALVVVHFAVTRYFYRAPTEAAVIGQVQGLAEAVLPFYSSSRQPLQADGVVISQADQIDARHFRYVASVTLRLRKPLYVPAVSNGTVAYRRLQEVLQRARDQDLRYKLFSETDGPVAPTLPQLLQRTHQAGETIVVRVPFTARRFGWQWRLDSPQIALHQANRQLQGDSLERYAGAPYLIFGGTATLAEIRQRTKLANNYVLAVAKEIQRHADVEAVADARPALADRPAQPDFADRPAVASVADLPAVTSLADRPAQVSLADLPAKPAEEPPTLGGLAHVAARAAIDPDAPAVFSAPPVKFFSAPPHTAAR